MRYPMKTYDRMDAMYRMLTLLESFLPDLIYVSLLFTDMKNYPEPIYYVDLYEKPNAN